MPRAVSEQPARGPARSLVAARMAAVLLIGLLVGVSTSVLQKYLGSPWDSLVNAASPWLVPMFAAGVLWARPPAAALAGAATGLAELAGYYLTAAARGYPADQGILLFWVACALLGGPLFGAAGWAWWCGPAPLSGLGAAALPAAFLAEAAVAYAWRLHYWSSAALFAVLGAVVFVLASWHRQQYAAAGRWLLAAFPAGVVAELLLGLIYSQSF
jgi:Family of unknown function (DUF6518)